MLVRFDIKEFARDERGQALVESAFFLPILILSLISLIYFSQLGVLDERSQLAVRFGGNVAYQHGQPYALATLQDLLAAVLNPSPSQLAVFCTGTSGNPVNVQQAAADAVTQNQGNSGSASPAVYAGPSAAPFWKPAGVTAPSCNPTTISLQTSPSSPLIPVSLTGISVGASMNVPPLLRFLYGGSATSGVSAQWNVVNLGLPSQLLACNVPLLIVIELVLAAPSNPAGAGACPAAKP